MTTTGEHIGIAARTTLAVTTVCCVLMAGMIVYNTERISLNSEKINRIVLDNQAAIAAVATIQAHRGELIAQVKEIAERADVNSQDRFTNAMRKKTWASFLAKNPQLVPPDEP